VRVNVSDLLADRDGVRVLAFVEPLPAPGDDLAFAEPVTGEITLTGTAGGVSLRGRVHAIATCVCGACLKRFALPLTVDVGEDFGPRGVHPVGAAGARQGAAGLSAARDSAGEERELSAADFLVPVDADDTIDVTEVIRQHIVLALPIAPRCREDCRGLCQQCGADLNDGPCGCVPNAVDPRLDVLRRWRA
jgi:uncharacterized protein